MIHFCKANGKVSFRHLLACQTIMAEWRLENDTLILSLRKNHAYDDYLAYTLTSVKNGKNVVVEW